MTNTSSFDESWHNRMRKYRHAINIIFCCLPVFLAACGSPPPRLPVAVEQAQQAEIAAHRAMREGDLLRARELFTRSQWLQQSLDNLPGAAMASINLATVSHLMGDDKAALTQLDHILSDSALPYPPELVSVAAFRKAVILADSGNVADASQAAEVESALQLAEKYCLKSCAHTAGIANLRARLALQKNDYAATLKLAKVALDVSGDDKEELANARRVSAAAESAQGHHEAALAHYMAALELDKELGISARIATDLSGVANTLGQLGRKQEADAYARRAAAATGAARSLPGGAGKGTAP